MSLRGGLWQAIGASIRGDFDPQMTASMEGGVRGAHPLAAIPPVFAIAFSAFLQHTQIVSSMCDLLLDDDEQDLYFCDEDNDVDDTLVTFACVSSAKRRKVRVALPSDRTGLWERDILSGTYACGGVLRGPIICLDIMFF